MHFSYISNHKEYLFTSESVSEGHPDKICDQISDAVVDAYLAADPHARVAAETMVTPSKIIIAGEVRGPTSITPKDIEGMARKVVQDIGYEQDIFHWKKVAVEVMLTQQSPDIAQGVDGGENKEEGAGDQGIMFGYACNETDTYMPAPIYYAHRILQSISEARHVGNLPQFGPDAKSQVTLLYRDGAPVKADSIVVSIQHKEGVSQQEVRELVRAHVHKVLPEGWMCDEEKFYINPTGKFVIGGPESDCGLTGRKIIVDTYGGAAPHGGGAFSGKDPSKVDRSAAYIARYLAKNVVASGLAGRCTIQIAYAIGVARPLAVYVNTHGTGKILEDKLSDILQKLVDLSPRGIRKHLQLDRPIYQRTAAFGHFGREPDAEGGFSWEKTDLVNAITSEVKNLR